MEASALPASVGLARPRLAFGASLLRIRSDDQLVALFRDGNEDAFRVIHDRYRSRLHAYTRQMLAGSPHDCEDALQEVFVRAYYGLRANRRDLALRPWLYRVAHNRCVDELRRQPLVLLDPMRRRWRRRRRPRCAGRAARRPAAADRRRPAPARAAALGAADARAERHVLRRCRRRARGLRPGGQIAARARPGRPRPGRRGPGHIVHADPRGADPRPRSRRPRERPRPSAPVATAPTAARSAPRSAASAVSSRRSRRRSARSG